MNKKDFNKLFTILQQPISAKHWTTFMDVYYVDVFYECNNFDYTGEPIDRWWCVEINWNKAINTERDQIFTPQFVFEELYRRMESAGLSSSICSLYSDIHGDKTLVDIE